MPPSNATLLHRLAVLAGVLVLGATTVGTVAAANPVTFKPRNGGNAWDTGPTLASGRVIVSFRPGTGAAARASIAAAAGLTKIRDMRGVDMGVYQAARANLASLQQTMAVDSAVVSVTPDIVLHRDADPTGEPGWPDLWGLDNQGQQILSVSGTSNVDIDGLESEAITGGDPAVTVAVIDDGVDFSHPDLAARAWTNPGESGLDANGNPKETNGIDDDHNGYIDDVHGWDFCNGDNTVHDAGQDFHGTHVAGTIAASLDGNGIVGVAPNIKIMALKFIDNGNGPNQCGDTSLAIEAIAYAKSFGVTLSNDSWGGRGPFADFKPLYDAMQTSGILFIASAGNDGIDNDTNPSPAYPASFDLPNVISVAAADQNGGLADFSNFGHATVDIAAPGVNIVSSVPGGFFSGVPDPGWAYLSGTSMAAPHVTGVAALIESQDPSLRISTPANLAIIKAKLLGTGKPLPLTAGDTLTGRMVDARNALDQVPPTAFAPNGHAFVLGTALGVKTVSTTVGWPAGTDDLSGIGSYDLLQQTNGGAWSAAVNATPSRSAPRTLTVDSTYRFRVRARDRAGNLSATVDGPTITPKLYQETSSLVSYTGTWTSSASGYASAGRTRFATRAGASVTFRFNGRAVAIAAPKGSTRGSAKVYVDGVYAGIVDLHRSTSVNRILVFGRSWASYGAHSVKLVLNGTSGHPRFDVDAFAILR